MKAVERAKTIDAGTVVAELEKMRDKPTLFGPRTFTDKLHHQNKARMLITEIKSQKPVVSDEWTLSEPVPMDVLFGQQYKY